MKNKVNFNISHQEVIKEVQQNLIIWQRLQNSSRQEIQPDHVTTMK